MTIFSKRPGLYYVYILFVFLYHYKIGECRVLAYFNKDVGLEVLPSNKAGNLRGRPCRLWSWAKL